MNKSETYTECYDRCMDLINKGIYDQAMVCGHVLLDIYEAENETHAIENIFKGFERFFLNVPNSILHITYLHRLVEIHEREGNIIEQIDTMYDLAGDYISVEETSMATSILSRAIKLAHAAGYCSGEADIMNGLGNVEDVKGNYVEGLRYYENAFRIAKKCGYERGRRFYHNIGYMLKKLGNYEKAIESFKSALGYMEGLGDLGFCCNISNELGDAYRQNGEYELAQESLLKGQDLCNRSNSTYFLSENYLYQAKLYEAQGRYKEAYENFKKFHELEDIINKSKSQRDLKEFQYETNLKQKDEEHDIIVMKNLELDTYSKELGRTNKALKEALVEARLMQDKAIQAEKHAAYNRMIIGIAHQVNTSIGNIILATSHVQNNIYSIENNYRGGTLKKADMDNFFTNSHEDMSIIHRSYEKVTKFINSIRNVPIEMNEFINESKIEIVLNDCIENFRKEIKKYDCDVEISVGEGLPSIKGTDVIKHILNHFFENAFKYAFDKQDNCQIKISANLVEKRNLLITFTDNGRGIDDKVLPHVFDPFFTSDMGYFGGSGLGLYITYKTVTEVLGGTISCESEIDKGTVFSIELPISNRLPLMD